MAKRYLLPAVTLVCVPLLLMGNAHASHKKHGAALPQLIVANGDNGLAGLYTFRTLFYGDRVTHTFVLHNSGQVPVTLQRVQASCGCLTTVIGEGSLNHPPTLGPGRSVSLQVTLDTAQMPDIFSTSLLAGSETKKQVWVYTTADSLHPAAVLEMRGHIMSGVSMEPATLNFGNVGEAAGADRTVRIAYAAALYREGETRLVAPKGSSLRITPLPVDPAEKGETHYPGNHPDVVRSYRVSIAPHAPIGALSGQLRVEGLAARTLPLRTGKTKITPPALARSLPFVGQVKGSISAQPGTAVFGVVSLSLSAAKKHPGDEAERTRWILLQPEPAAVGKNIAVDLWQGATVRVDSNRFQAALVAPASSSPSSTGTGSSKLVPPPITGGRRSGSVYWLRLTIAPSAPRGKSLQSEATVTLRDGERLRVPIMVQTQ